MASLPHLSLHPDTTKEEIDPTRIVTQWLSSLETQLKDATTSTASNLFLPSDLPYWRDILALSWDWSTKKSSQDILSHLSSSTQGFGVLEAVTKGALQPALVDLEGAVWIQSGFTFRNRFGQGRGLVRLVNGDDGEWRAWTVFTQLEGLDDYQGTGKVVPPGDEQDEYQVLVIGAGQSGLAIGAHLQHQGLKYLVVDKNHRVGDSWRARYESITTHTPTYSDHYPFLPYPDDFPQWLGRDRIADWQEYYAKTMELNIELAIRAEVFKYDETSKKYTIHLHGPNNNTRAIHCTHLILAAGMFSPKPIVPSLPNQDTFTGSVHHTSQHTSASKIPNLSSKNVLCIGSGTSSHDIAQDFVHAGAKSVTMLQRTPIVTVTRTSYITTQMGLWNTPGISTAEADILGNSFPFPIIRALNLPATKKMNEMDTHLLEPMQEKGYRVLKDVGLVDQQFLKGGRFYIDQGACEMIADGRIKILNCEAGIEKFTSNGLRLADGRELEADIVVFGTGFELMEHVVEQIMGSAIKEKVGDIGHLDSEAERIGWWRPTGMPGLWYMTGSFLWTRTFSSVLALQIAAVERGLNSGYYTQETDGRLRRKAD
ncbi:hypothetical protein M409DRAFT_68714 [Zasmidium cellare ATCC 36951]|uniref:FAD/NAD(P)-binding domain-containing protein n=1 Tax=Zasmidium cellare ATCC 36951 TaxID=1080233 RepID=A0A6A6CAZ4_ZASCE|nr:uncharacterized protein M409DRAFT_68714 [Zasmidium cellare ATCC 36951]KAF2163082.1 hypothetical protein M409DRAFT_68714 [Zasmidium cellare ATCC 36951]